MTHHRCYPDSVPSAQIELLDCDRARQLLAFVACTTDDPWDMLYGVSEADFGMAERLCHDDGEERREVEEHDRKRLEEVASEGPPEPLLTVA
jgi:hypothetical protein